MNFKLIICIFGCVTIDKYRNQIKKIKETYEKYCNKDVKMLFFLGENKYANYHEDNFIYLPNIGDDYISASYKQQLGLKYIHDNYNPDFVLCCGTDTFINIPKLLLFIEKFDRNKNLYIGGHGCHRNISGKSYYFHSGGPGFIISNECLKKLYPYLNNLTDNWTKICKDSGIDNLIPACDVAISYFLQYYVHTDVIKTNDLSFIHCNHRGYPCHVNKIIMKDIISCHSMSLKDFDEFNNILKINNYFL